MRTLGDKPVEKHFISIQEYWCLEGRMKALSLFKKGEVRLPLKELVKRAVRHKVHYLDIYTALGEIIEQDHSGPAELCEDCETLLLLRSDDPRERRKGRNIILNLPASRSAYSRLR